MVNAWHFTAEPLTLRDGTPFALNEPLPAIENPVPCERGYHASLTVYDALTYAPGPHLYRVTLGGTIVSDGDPVDKYVASERTATAYVNATPLIRSFTRQCALDVIHLWNPPDVVRQFLLTGDERLRAAAWDASWASWAAWFAWDAAAWDAAAWAARAAAWAAWAAAWDAAAAWAARAARASWAAWDAAKRHQIQTTLESWTISYMETGVLPEVKVK